MSTSTLPIDLLRSLLNRRIRREVDATVTDYVRLGDWDEQLAVSVVERMLHHKDAHGVLCSHWAALIDQQPGKNSGGSPKQAPPRGLASQAAEVARRLLLWLLPFKPQLFTSSVCTLLLGVLHCLINIGNETGGESSLRQLQRFSGSQHQYEDTVECALQALEGPAQQQLQPQQPEVLAPEAAMRLLAGLCASGHNPLLRKLCSARCATLAARCLFNPHNIHASRGALTVLDMLQHEAQQGETLWACDPIFFTSTIADALGHAEACMVWHAAYSNAAFAQAARVPYNDDTASQHFTAFGDELCGCSLLVRATDKLPFGTAADFLVRRPGLLRALCTMCDSAARHVVACGASTRAPQGLWFDKIAKMVAGTLGQCTCWISTSPHPGPAHVRAIVLGLSCLLRICERAPRLHATTTSAVRLSFMAWRCIQGVIKQQGSGVASNIHRARAVLAVLVRTHALGRLLEAAVRTERWLEGRPGGVADITSNVPCHVVEALLEAAVLAALCVLLVSAAPDDDGIDSMAGLLKQPHLAEAHRIQAFLLDARESFMAGGSAAALRVPALVPGLVRDLQHAIAALAPHGIPDFSIF